MSPNFNESFFVSWFQYAHVLFLSAFIAVIWPWKSRVLEHRCHWWTTRCYCAHSPVRISGLLFFRQPLLPWGEVTILSVYTMTHNYTELPVSWLVLGLVSATVFGLQHVLYWSDVALMAKAGFYLGYGKCCACQAMAQRLKENEDVGHVWSISSEIRQNR